MPFAAPTTGRRTSATAQRKTLQLAKTVRTLLYKRIPSPSCGETGEGDEWVVPRRARSNVQSISLCARMEVTTGVPLKASRRIELSLNI